MLKIATSQLEVKMDTSGLIAEILGFLLGLVLSLVVCFFIVNRGEIAEMLTQLLQLLK